MKTDYEKIKKFLPIGTLLLEPVETWSQMPASANTAEAVYVEDVKTIYACSLYGGWLKDRSLTNILDTVQKGDIVIGWESRSNKIVLGTYENYIMKRYHFSDGNYYTDIKLATPRDIVKWRKNGNRT